MAFVCWLQFVKELFGITGFSIKGFRWLSSENHLEPSPLKYLLRNSKKIRHHLIRISKKMEEPAYHRPTHRFRHAWSTFLNHIFHSGFVGILAIVIAPATISVGLCTICLVTMLVGSSKHHPAALTIFLSSILSPRLMKPIFTSSFSERQAVTTSNKELHKRTGPHDIREVLEKGISNGST